MNKIIVIVGPTASGKSDLAIKIAKKFGGEIISADSRQVYRGMDIGTGKVSKKEQRIVPHHLIDVANPKKQFTADDFKRQGQKAINDIFSRGKVPIIVGGTGFYIDVLLGRISVAEVPPDKKLRAWFDKLTVEHLFKMLQKLDPRRARTIEPKNKHRLIRALEIILSTGRPVPKLESSIKYPADAKALAGRQILWIGLKPKNLEKRIKKRLDARLKQGMVREVINLHNPPAGGGVGWRRLDDFGLEYRWISRWLKNHKNNKSDLFSNSQEYENLLKDIIKYSKRQMTWFTQPHPWEKNNPKKIHWISSPLQASKLVKDFLK